MPNIQSRPLHALNSATSLQSRCPIVFVAVGLASRSSPLLAPSFRLSPEPDQGTQHLRPRSYGPRRTYSNTRLIDHLLFSLSPPTHPHPPPFRTPPLPTTPPLTSIYLAIVQFPSRSQPTPLFYHFTTDLPLHTPSLSDNTTVSHYLPSLRLVSLPSSSRRSNLISSQISRSGPPHFTVKEEKERKNAVALNRSGHCSPSHCISKVSGSRPVPLDQCSLVRRTQQSTPTRTHPFGATHKFAAWGPRFL